ncbi:SWI/SNF complex subunit SWI3A isoform X1 [Cryptomeria japonica]|uniref:SWI/SNF complex subunit SWI3A isoform X1 n=1 Tax=Cryptomeria japonica TaxID=3369 RepID=UPI0027DAAB1F|nr:SWI/SNF complex subunit SWI3A isoform X1 [Cryptomeria japonica]
MGSPLNTISNSNRKDTPEQPMEPAQHLGECSQDQLAQHDSTPVETKGAEPLPAIPSSNPNIETYTIPSYARWFSWNKIHETERISLNEFFDGRSSSKTPKIYKEYRDFMINKYREDPLKRVTFTEMRKMLVGDVTSIHKVFDFLETWGLINFQAPLDSKLQTSTKVFAPVVLDNVTPNGIRVVSPPKSAKHTMLPNMKGKIFGRKVSVGEGAALASYRDVFNIDKVAETTGKSEIKSARIEREPTTKRFCNNCRADCTASCFNCQKQAGFVLCTKCFEDGKYGLGLCAADFKLNNLHQESIEVGSDGWTDQELLLLLEGTLLYSDDWKSVAQHVHTKNEIDCIMKLIQLPFGEQFMVNVGIESNDNSRSSNLRNEKKASDQAFSLKDSTSQNYQENNCEEGTHTTEDDVSGPPLKRSCLSPIADVGNPIMGQVSFLSTMVGSRVAVAAAEAAIAALCEEDPSASQIIHPLEIKSLNQKSEPSLNGLELESTRKSFQLECNKEPEGSLNATTSAGIGEDSKGDFHFSQKGLPVTHLQMRAAIATALGAAGARAKLLADQEERDIEHLMSIIIENQLKKLYFKIGHFEEIENIMEKEYALMEQIKELLLTERIHVIRESLNSIFRRL